MLCFKQNTGRPTASGYYRDVATIGDFRPENLDISIPKRYDEDMKMDDATDRLLSLREVSEGKRRRLEAQHLQAIEGNPLTPDEMAMFEMFERERWSHRKCRQYILDRAHASDGPASTAE